MSGVVLGPDYRRRLRQFQLEHGRRLRVTLGVDELRNAMSAPFGAAALGRALRGQPVMESTRNFLVQWLDRYYPEPVIDLARDYKRAAGNDAEPDEKFVDAVNHGIASADRGDLVDHEEVVARTKRGSR
jgi:hypothetical protein